MKTKIAIIVILLTGGFFAGTADAQDIIVNPKYNTSSKMPNGPLVTIANPWAWPNHIISDKKDISSVLPSGMDLKPLNPAFKKKPIIKSIK